MSYCCLLWMISTLFLCMSEVLWDCGLICRLDSVHVPEFVGFHHLPLYSRALPPKASVPLNMPDPIQS